MIRIFTLFLITLSLFVQADTFKELAFDPENSAIDGVTKLPIKHMIAIESGGRYIFSSENGRYAFSGKLIDLWTGETYSESSDDLADLNKLPKQKLDQILGGLAFLEGEHDQGASEYHYVFVDPHCPHCINAMTALASQNIPVRWVLMPMLGQKSTQDSVLFYCAKDRQLALATLIQHGSASNLEQSTDCDKKVFQRNIVASRLLSIPGVPYTIRGDGDVKRGYDNDYLTWITETL